VRVFFGDLNVRAHRGVSDSAHDKPHREKDQVNSVPSERTTFAGEEMPTQLCGSKNGWVGRFSSFVKRFEIMVASFVQVQALAEEDRIRLTDIPQKYCRKNVLARAIGAFQIRS